MNTTTDSRITDLRDLEATESRDLAYRPRTILAIEDAGWMVDPFTGQLWREDPSCLPAAAALRCLVNNLHGLGGVL